VSRACECFFKAAYPEHSIEIIDPLDYELGGIFKPHFAYAKSRVPSELQTLADKIQEAQGYVMVSPEYNHSMSPALSHLLNHFGSSLFSYKPSSIVTYSAGQWGGTRAAVGMRSFLSELGCLPVSAMIHVPFAQDVFNEQGLVAKSEEEAQWQTYFFRTLNQLVWWAQAAQAQAVQQNPHAISQAFIKDPSQRNAP
jgi:NAD(P)H-dependent FMN reductase